MGEHLLTEIYAELDGNPTFPSVVDVAVTNHDSATTNHTVMYPSGTRGTVLIISCFDWDAASTLTPPSGWDQLVNETQGTATFRVTAYVYEAGASDPPVTFVTDVAEKSTHICYRFKNAQIYNFIAAETPDVSTRATGTSTAPNAPSLAPDGGSDKYLWVTAFAGAAVTSTSAAPTNYTDLQQGTLTGADGVEVASAVRQVEGASEDAGAFTTADSIEWAAFTIAIYPDGWTDLTSDVVGNPPLTWRTGLESAHPLSLVMPPGRISFALNNSAVNSAGVEGRYTPEHTNVLSGWHAGIRVKLVFAQVTTTAQSHYIYTIDRIRIMGGEMSHQRAMVTGTDWLGRAGAITLRDVDVLTDQGDDDVFEALWALVPDSIKPLSRSRPGTNTDNYPFVFDDINTRDTSLLEMYHRLAQTSLNIIGMDGGNWGDTLYMHRRWLRMTVEDPGSGVTFSAPTFLEIQRDKTLIFNVIECVATARRADTTTVVLASIEDDRPLIGKGETVVIALSHRDPSLEAERVSGTDMIDPLVATTDYTMNANSSGTGDDLTSDHVVTVDHAGGNSEVSITNNATVNSYLTHLQVRGKGLYTYRDQRATAEDAASIAVYGERRLLVRVPWQSDVNTCQSLADWLLTRHKDEDAPGTRTAIMEVNGDRSALEASDVATLFVLPYNNPCNITESKTGLPWVAGEKWHLVNATYAKGSDQMVKARYTLAYWGVPDDLWRLGTGPNDALGTDTTLGYF